MIRKCRICGQIVENIMDGRMVTDKTENQVYWVHESCWQMKWRVIEGPSTFYNGKNIMEKKEDV